MNTDNVLSIFDVDVIYAVNTGSRVIGMAGPNSDYDVRLVFRYPMEEYLKINRPKDYIRVDTNGYDVVGYDVYKFAELFLKSNMEVLEWCVTDHILLYTSNPLIAVARELVDRGDYDRATIVRHCLGHSDSLVKKKFDGDVYRIKYVLATINKLMQADWIARGGKMAVMTVRERLLLDNILPERVKIDVEQLLQLRRSGVDECTDRPTVDWLLDNYSDVREQILDKISDFEYRQRNREKIERALLYTIRR